MKREVEMIQEVLATDPRPEHLREWHARQADRWLHARFYYRYLYAAAQEFRPAVMVELGTDHGFGAWHLATGHPSGMVIAVDQTLERVAPPVNSICKFIRFERSDTLTAKFKMPTKIGLILFDSTHTRAHARKEFLLYDPLCKSGALQLFDDIEESGDMRRFWDELPGPKHKCDELHPSWRKGKTPGFGIRVKP